MPIEYKLLRCPRCRRVRRAQRNGPNHMMHLALTILSGGMWCVAWAWIALSNGDPYRCAVCDRDLGRLGRTPLWLDVLAVIILAAIVALGLALWIAWPASRAN